jgi:deoxyribose-phosphate aldolase
MSIAQYIDHTLLKSDATGMQIRQLCAEALEYQFATVCVNPCWVKLAAMILHGTPVKTCAVVGFPLGANRTAIKVHEAVQAFSEGAREIDMVMNIGAFKSGNLQKVAEDIRSVRSSLPTATLKVIIETCLLTHEEKFTVCSIVQDACADFVKTSTGFSSGGATVEDVRFLWCTVGSTTKVKASGGMRTYEDAKRMLEAGATRLGCSASVAIVQGEPK